MTASLHSAACSCTRCRGFEPGNLVAVRHGASSESRIRPLARNHKRRVLRQIGLRAGDVDPIGRAYLEGYCRLVAKVELIDLWIDEHGLLQPDGEPQPAMKLYVQLHNAAGRALARLAEHLQRRDPELDYEGALRELVAR